MRTSSNEASPIREGTGRAESGDSARPARRRGHGLLKGTAELLVGAAVLVVVATVFGPLVLPYRTYFVRTGSMRPTLPVGALAVYRPVPAEQLHQGDIVAFHRPGGHGEIVSHRIVGVESGPDGRSFVTKGDANGAPDPWRVPVGGTGLRYSFNVAYLGYIVGELGSPMGRSAILLVIVSGLAVAGLVKIWRPRGPGPATNGENDLPADSTPVGQADPIPLLVACQLKDCLTVVLGHAELLMRATPPDDDRRVDVEAIERASRHAVAVGARLVGCTSADTAAAAPVDGTVRGRSGTPPPAPWTASDAGPPARASRGSGERVP